MSTVKTNNANVITDIEIENLTQLLETTLFDGINVNIDKSLFTKGFIYDERTETVIFTQPRHYWTHMKEPIKFKVGKLSVEDIHESFKSRKDDIMFLTNLDEDQWYSQINVMKILNIEYNHLGASDAVKEVQHLDSHELIRFLEIYIQNNYAHLLE